MIERFEIQEKSCILNMSKHKITLKIGELNLLHWTFKNTLCEDHVPWQAKCYIAKSKKESLLHK